MRFSTSGFYHDSAFSRPLSIPLGPFRKICGHKLLTSPMSLLPAINKQLLQTPFLGHWRREISHCLLLVGSLKMNTTLEYSTRVVQEGDRRCKKSTLNDLAYLTPLRIPLMNPVYESYPSTLWKKLTDKFDTLDGCRRLNYSGVEYFVYCPSLFLLPEWWGDRIFPMMFDSSVEQNTRTCRLFPMV
jgi:hypothetical protein